MNAIPGPVVPVAGKPVDLYVASDGKCRDVAGPCPHVVCRHHLDCRTEGWQVPRPRECSYTCALEVAEMGSHSASEVGYALGLGRERVRQIEKRALAKIRRRAPELFEVFLAVFRDRVPFAGSSRDDSDDGERGETEEEVRPSRPSESAYDGQKSLGSTYGIGRVAVSRRLRSCGFVVMVVERSAIDTWKAQTDKGVRFVRYLQGTWKISKEEPSE